jgi:hypothetical protein
MDFYMLNRGEQEFLEACVSGNLEKVIEVLNTTGIKENQVALNRGCQEAIRNGHKHVLEYIIERFPDKNDKWRKIADHGYNLIITAIESNHKDILEYIIKLVPNVEDRDIMIQSIGNQAFEIAASMGNKHAVNCLFKLTPDLSNREAMINANEEKALKSAVEHGRSNILEYMFEHTTDLQARESLSFKVTSMALMYGNKQVLSLSLEYMSEYMIDFFFGAWKKGGSKNCAEPIKGYLNPELAILIGKQRRALRELGYDTEQIEGIERFAEGVHVFMSVSKNPITLFDGKATPDIQKHILLNIAGNSNLSPKDQDLVLGILSHSKTTRDPILQNQVIDGMYNIVNKCVELSQYIAITLGVTSPPEKLTSQEEIVLDKIIFTSKVQAAAEKRRSILDKTETGSSRDIGG